MKGKNEGLQKLTESDKINSLFAKKKILKGDPGQLLNEKEINIFSELLSQKLNECKGIERDNLLEQVEEILPVDTKNQLWENNHLQITISISKQIEETGKMPTKNQIASDSGLSRQTVYKHLKGYADHPLYAEQLQQFQFMADRVLAKVIKAATLGDLKAARLYFDIIGTLKGQASNNTLIKNQNNYIQINSTILSQENIKQLNPDQLIEIENILKKAFPLQPQKI